MTWLLSLWVIGICSNSWSFSDCSFWTGCLRYEPIEIIEEEVWGILGVCEFFEALSFGENVHSLSCYCSFKADKFALISDLCCASWYNLSWCFSAELRRFGDFCYLWQILWDLGLISGVKVKVDASSFYLCAEIER